MIKIDLITGFLGSGKTTFLKKYAKYLMEEGLKIGILENDYGAVNVDMMLLQELRGENCELEMVLGGCDADCHKRRFKTKLISMGMSGYDRVVIEPSGIFDMDEFFDSLYEEPLCNWYEIGSVFTIVDGNLDQMLSAQSKYLLASQIAHAGKVILSKVNYCTEKQLMDTINYINEIMKSVQCPRRFDNSIVMKDWDSITKKEWSQIAASGYRMEDYLKYAPEVDEGFMSCYYMNVTMSEEKLKEQVTKMMQDSSCGTVFRVKGFLQPKPGCWIELNATKNQIMIQPISKGQEVVIVIGENLKERAVDSYWKPYCIG